MHLGNGAITPECALLTASAAALGLGFAAASARRAPQAPHSWLAAGTLGAAVFAAQMFNFPVLPYSSGHLLGGVLLAIALGPGLGALVMAAVLTLQAFLLGDGGVLALGANILNMALLPAAIVGLGGAGSASASSVRAGLRAGVQATAAVLGAAALIVLEVVLFRSDAAEMPLRRFAVELLGVHALIGLAEGVLTGLIVWAARGQLVPETRSLAVRNLAIAGAVACLLLAALPLASALPDGYEASAERSGWERLLAASSQQFAVWQENLALSVASFVPHELALAVGATLVAGAVSACFAWLCCTPAKAI